MTLRLSPEQDHLLEQLARHLAVSKQEAAARAIVEAAQRHAHQAAVAHHADHAQARFADVLRRLGQ
jgi:predicted transcriptional regulator